MNPTHLTLEEKEDIIEQLMDNPMETVSYPKSLEDDRNGYQSTDYFGLVEDENGVHVFSVDDSERDLMFGGTFVNRAQAMEKLCECAYSTQEAAEQSLRDERADERARIAFEQGAHH